MTKATKCLGKWRPSFFGLKVQGIAGAKARSPCVHLRLAFECQTAVSGGAGKGSKPQSAAIRQVFEAAPRGMRGWRAARARGPCERDDGLDQGRGLKLVRRGLIHRVE